MCAIVDLPIRLMPNAKRISGNSLTPLGSQNKDIGAGSSSLEKVLCKQLHGTVMGSPVSVVVAEIVMQNIEEQAVATCTRTIPPWLRYVDDTFTATQRRNRRF